MSSVRLRLEPDDLKPRIGGIDAEPPLGVLEPELTGGLYETGGRLVKEERLSSAIERWTVLSGSRSRRDWVDSPSVSSMDWGSSGVSIDSMAWSLDNSFE